MDTDPSSSKHRLFRFNDLYGKLKNNFRASNCHPSIMLPVAHSVYRQFYCHTLMSLFLPFSCNNHPCLPMNCQKSLTWSVNFYVVHWFTQWTNSARTVRSWIPNFLQPFEYTTAYYKRNLTRHRAICCPVFLIHYTPARLPQYWNNNCVAYNMALAWEWANDC